MAVGGTSFVLAYPEFIQLMDDDIVSLIGLVLIANALFRVDNNDDIISQLPLSLYFMTQCQLKLHHPVTVTSLAQLLDYVEVTRRHLDAQN